MVKLKASTLIETLTASTIMIIITVIISLTFINLNKFGNYSVKVRAYFMLEQMKTETNKDKLFFDEEISIENITIIKELIEYKEEYNLFILNYKVFYNKKRLLIESKELILKNE